MGLSGFASSPEQLGIYRFLTGLGMGGVMPNSISLMTEYAPKKIRTTLVCLMFSGYSVGAITAAGLGIVIIPEVGWKTMFWIGSLPLLLLPVVYKWLPESINFHVIKGQNQKIKSLLVRINPHFKPQSNDNYVMNNTEQTGSRFTVIQLFENKRSISTIIFWLASFMILLMIYGLNTWLPKLMQNFGYPLGSSLMFLVVLNLGLIIGAVYGGWLADRFGDKKVLLGLFIMGGIVITLLGFKAHMAFMYLLVALAGASTGGAQMLLNAYISQFYPAIIRSTGVGWSLGIGRIGAIVGPTLGGILLAVNIPLQAQYNNSSASRNSDALENFLSLI